MFHSVWLPPLTLGNSLADDQIHLFDTEVPFPVTVTSSGTVTWYAPVQLQTTCVLDMTYFPNDKHTCILYILAAGYSKNELNFVAVDSTNPTQFYKTDGLWALDSSTVAVGETDLLGRSISAVVLTVTFKRLPAFFVINLLFPSAALSFLNILAFVLPVSSGEKVSREFFRELLKQVN